MTKGGVGGGVGERYLAGDEGGGAWGGGHQRSKKKCTGFA